MGDWIVEERDVMDFIRKGFEGLFTSSKSFSYITASPPSRWQISLSDLDRESLATPVFEEEVKATLWLMKAFKYPSPDGLHAGFFQYFWPTVSPKVVHEVKRIFSSRSWVTSTEPLTPKSKA